MKSLKCNLGYHKYQKRQILATHLYDRKKARFLQRCQNCDSELLFDAPISNNLT